MITYHETKSKDDRYIVIIHITKENVAYGADVIDWSAGGVVYYNLPVFFEKNSNAIASNNYCNINESRNVHVVLDKKNACDKVNGFVFIDTNNGSVNNDQYAKEIDLLKVLYSNVTDKNEVMSKLEEFNEINTNSIIFSKFEILIKIKKVTDEAKEEIKLHNEIGQVKDIKDEETVAAKKEINENQIEKEEKKAEVVQTKPGVNLQCYCANENCLAAKTKFLKNIIKTSAITFFLIKDKKKFLFTNFTDRPSWHYEQHLNL
ncbi:putative peptidoglycan N-acetylglucosamine deacetylase [Reticulomyxa filosa]|uniref:Putative peptidoglycan N-acetylglucosamine deacetylase n=1 Tax=Reticulomyxa filosa TaxID=46433 RepID=X6MQ43_RETFI|nr:putative peptidoglycan N-acetylglucosamine deacetylase [Reticulomyxa filosa]|eukprot:ETO15552.1 putative peptidoglycan N-acetylglucosamine deacetylase [Reticulomyxa filosa]